MQSEKIYVTVVKLNVNVWLRSRFYDLSGHTRYFVYDGGVVVIATAAAS